MRYQNLNDSYDVVTFFSGPSKRPLRPSVLASRVVQRPVSNKWLEPVYAEYYMTPLSRPNIYDSYYHAVHHAYGPATPLDIKSVKRRELRRYRRRHHEYYSPDEYDTEEE